MTEGTAVFLLGYAPEGLSTRHRLERLCVQDLADGQVRAALVQRTADATQVHCWLVLADGQGAWRDAVAALRDSGMYELMPWALWLRTCLDDPDIQGSALELGAVDIVCGDDCSEFQHRIALLGKRLRSPHGPWAELRRARLAHQAMHSTLNNVPAPIFIKDVDGRYVECNQAFLDYLGLPREKVIAHTVHDIAPPALARIYDEADRRLLREGNRQIYDTQVRWADGAVRDVTFYKTVVRDHSGGVIGQAGVIFDITEKKHLESTLRMLSDTDPLTGILNRRSFIEQAALRVGDRRASGEPLTLILFDVDHFKVLNDTHGHVFGDGVLRELSALVAAHLRPDDLFARIGGDEFAILLRTPKNGNAVVKRLPRLVASKTFAVAHGGQRCTISVGGVTLTPGEIDVDQMLIHADQALYEAKRKGRNAGVIRMVACA